MMIETQKLPSVQDIPSLRGMYVLVRASLNVPMDDGKVLDEFRLKRGLETTRFLIEAGAKVILMGHIGRGVHESLRPVYEILKEYIPLQFSSEILGSETDALRAALQDGQVLLLENVRQDMREEQNDLGFAEGLAKLADVYVNDSFDAAHRAHASLVGVPRYLPSYAGVNFIREYEELTKATAPESPSLFLLGGAKFETKMPLVERFLEHYDRVFIGGALANDMFRGKGYEVGFSLISDVDLTGSPLLTHPKILMPVDVTVKSDEGIRVCAPTDVQKHEAILDAGPQTMEMLAPHIRNARTILWNGPLGNYEHGFAKQSEVCAQYVSETTAYTVIGGGDTIAVIDSLGLSEKYNFLSTAGGAMLSFLEHGTLPAIEAMRTSPAR